MAGLSIAAALAGAHAATPVTVAWSSPAAGTTVSGTASLTLKGQAFQNVEIFRDGKMLVRAAVSADHKTATAKLDTAQLPVGTVTLTAHAWDSPAGTAFTSEADAGALALKVARASTAPVTLSWSQPAPGSTVGATATLKLQGQSFQNVEIFRAGTMLARATVSADHKTATANVDTTRLPNGSLTLTAHAWNSPPGTAFTSEADAGPLALTVNNAASTTGVGLGAYVGGAGDDAAALLAFESWLGRRVDGVLEYGAKESWSDFTSSIPAAIRGWQSTDRPVFWSIPLITTGSTLAAAARGDYDGYYRSAAQALVKYRPQDAHVNVRTGWEFNGDWFPWSVGNQSTQYVGAFRRFVQVFRQVASENGTPGRFVFEWTPNQGYAKMADPGTAYPGDDVVDVIGMDFYWDTRYYGNDPAQAWSQFVGEPFGLQWHQDFAASHGKPTAYSEWGVMSDNAGPFIDSAHAWFESHHVLFATYWDSNLAFPGKLSAGQYPDAGAAFRADFSRP